MNFADALLANVYVQVDTIRGSRYLDEVGRLMNNWETEFPYKQLSDDGLRMTNAYSQSRQLWVNAERIWLHFLEPDTLTYVSDHSRRIVEQVCQTIEVTTFSRVGLRLQHFVPADNLGDAAHRLRLRVFSEAINNAFGSYSNAPRREGDGEVAGFEFMLPVITDEFVTMLRAVPVQRSGGTEKSRDMAAQGILIDVDVFRSDGAQSIQDFRRFLRNVESWSGRGLPEIAGAFLPGG